MLEMSNAVASATFPAQARDHAQEGADQARRVNFRVERSSLLQKSIPISPTDSFTALYPLELRQEVCISSLIM